VNAALSREAHAPLSKGSGQPALLTTNWRSSCLKLLRYENEARSFSYGPSLHFLGCVIDNPFRWSEYDFDPNPNLS
jgi:hypothetical protein